MIKFPLWRDNQADVYGLLALYQNKKGLMLDTPASLVYTISSPWTFHPYRLVWYQTPNWQLENTKLFTGMCIFHCKKICPWTVSIQILFWPRFIFSTPSFYLRKPLTHLINLSLTQGKFPDSLKIAKVVPVFKQGSHMLCTNYRPISVLPALSKIFEKCMFNQLMLYISFHDVFTPNQYGFRSGKNTTDCLVDLLEQITKSIDNGEFAITLFLDLSKAFDTVNHSILL